MKTYLKALTMILAAIPFLFAGCGDSKEYDKAVTLLLKGSDTFSGFAVADDGDNTKNHVIWPVQTGSAEYTYYKRFPNLSTLTVYVTRKPSTDLTGYIFEAKTVKYTSSILSTDTTTSSINLVYKGE